MYKRLEYLKWFGHMKRMIERRFKVDVDRTRGRGKLKRRKTERVKELIE